MPKSTKREESEYRYPDTEFYPCDLVKVVEVEHSFFRKDKVTGIKGTEQDVFRKWEWSFLVVSGPYEGETLRGDSQPELTTREDNRARMWSESLMGREIAVGEEFDTDTIVGLPCICTVRHDPPRERGDGSKFFPCPVDEVLPRSGGFDNPDAPPF